MSILGRIFSTEAAMERSVEAVVKGLDKLVYTSEEKAEATAKARAEAQAKEFAGVVEFLKAALGERVFDRLREDGGEVVTFAWESQRGRAAA